MPADWFGLSMAIGSVPTTLDRLEAQRMTGRETRDTTTSATPVDRSRIPSRKVDASVDTLQQFVDGVKFPEIAVPEFFAGATLLKTPPGG